LPVVAQWTAELQASGSRYWGTTREVGVPNPHSFRPYRPTTIGLRAEYAQRSLGFAVTVYNAGSGYALEGDDGAVLVNGVLSVTGIAPEIDIRVASIPGGGRIALGGGPLVEVWGVQDESSRARIGGHVAGMLEVPLGGRWRAAVRGGIALLPSSILNDHEVTSNFERRATWRRSLTLGLGYRL
jgi:hypothetical protein